MQTVQTLIRLCIQQCLIWVCTVCQLPFWTAFYISLPSVWYAAQLCLYKMDFWPRWLSWMRLVIRRLQVWPDPPPRPGRQPSFMENDLKILSMVIPPFCWFKKGSCQFLPIECAQYLVVCVEVLRPSQPNGVMSSAVSLPNHTFTGQA